MTIDPILIQKREDLKRRLAAGEYKTFVDVFLEWFERLLRKIIRQKEPLPTWLITIILSLSLTFICFAIVYISGDNAILLIFTRASGLGILIEFSESVIAIAITIALNQYIRKIFTLWRDEVLNATESLLSLNDFEDWLKKTCNWRLHLLVTTIAVIILTPIGTSLIKTQWGISVGYGSVLSLFIFSMFIYALIYLFLMAILLSARLRRYELKLFAADPSSSKLISHLSSELSRVIYIVAVYAIIGLISIGFVFGVVDLYVVIAQLLLGWLPIIALFILIQTSLSSLIRRAKWKTLTEIQSQVEELHAMNNLKDKETMEAINRLMDFHDRVKATRNSAIDSSTIINFINSLLLPLLAFLLGNLDKVLPFFSRKP